MAAKKQAKKTITTMPLSNTSAALVKARRTKAFLRRIEALSEDDLRACVANLAFALADLRDHLPDYGVFVELCLGEKRPEASA